MAKLVDDARRAALPDQALQVTEPNPSSRRLGRRLLIPSCRAVKSGHPAEIGGRRGNLSVDPRKTWCPPVFTRVRADPPVAAPDLACIYTHERAKSKSEENGRRRSD